jgi:penicillin-binding protein 2
MTVRPIASTYPVGSTFKLITTVAGLAEKKLTPDTQFGCPGYFMFAGRPWKCHKKSGHGSLNLKRALGVSCNAFYFQLGQLLGIELIERYAKMMGLGTQTGVDLPGEVAGIVPSDEWKRKKYGVRWYPGDTLPVAIGQGYVVATPIQMAVMMSTIANGGTVYRPHLVKKVNPRDGAPSREIKSEIIRNTGISPKVLADVREIAAGVVNDQGSTGRAAKFDEFRVGGKTGTAQVTVLGREKSAEGLGDHAWFVAMAPVENPVISLAIIVENAGHGGTAAAPISHQIMEVFFKKKGVLKDPVPEGQPEEAAIQEGVGDDAGEEHDEHELQGAQ